MESLHTRRPLPATAESTKTDAAARAWPILAKLVRDTDEGKIKDYKEDIDTLLVFAGLFSAVMTAFLIESYKGLQEDPGAIAIQLLAEIAAQGRVPVQSEAAYLSTANMTSVPFVAPASAVRVNVLWFASLSFSLITASFAMMVKQWLREYLADGQSGAETRLRIRHFRLPGIIDWKVFEIAALLPILLQLALGLFLTGLCFFAWSVHPTVGQTCIPLVAAWGLCIVSSSLAPAWFPRCPYKLPFLIGPLRHVRRFLRMAVLDVLYAYQLLRYRTSRSRRRVVVTNHLHGPMSWTNRPHRDPTDLDYECTEEAWAISYQDYDAAILSAVDAQYNDDDLLQGPILDAVWGCYDAGEYITDFVVDVVRRRYPYTDLSSDKLPTDLRHMSSKQWDIAIGTCLDALRNYVYRGSVTSFEFPGLRTALLLVFSRTTPIYWERIKPTVYEVLSKMFENATSRVALHACSAFAMASGFGSQNEHTERLLFECLQKLSGVLVAIGGERGYRVVEQIVGRRIRGEYATIINSRRGAALCTFRLCSIRSTAWTPSLTSENIDDVRMMIIPIVNAALEQQTRNDSWETWLTEALTFIVESYTIDMLRTWNFPLTESRKSFTVGEPFLLLAMQHRRSALETLRCLAHIELEDWSAWNIKKVLHGIYYTDSGARTALRNFQHVVVQHDDLDIKPCPLRLCHIALRFIRLPHAFPHLALWRSLLLDMATLLRQCTCTCADHLTFAEQCMHLVHALECHNIQFPKNMFIVPEERTDEKPGYYALDDEALYHAWLNNFDEKAALFPDELIGALVQHTGKEGTWYRERRLRRTLCNAPCEDILSSNERGDPEPQKPSSVGEVPKTILFEHPRPTGDLSSAFFPLGPA